MARPIIAGEPGESWTNDTGKVRWQFLCSLQNTCGLCLQFHRQIGPFWPIPMHRSCRCQQVPIYPGDEAHPFVDFRELIRDLDPAQRNRVVGQGALRLIETGTVAWSDVVSSGRIRTLKEVIATHDLTAARLVKAGFPKARAADLVAKAIPEEAKAADRSAKLLADLLKGRGFTAAEIHRHTGERAAARVGVRLRPSGPVTMARVLPRPPLIPILPAAPAAPQRPTPPATPIRREDALRLIEFALGPDAVERVVRVPETVGDLDALLLELGSKVDHDALTAMLRILGID